jgi:putative exporter of polyketide antibiotics
VLPEAAETTIPTTVLSSINTGAPDRPADASGALAEFAEQVAAKALVGTLVSPASETGETTMWGAAVAFGFFTIAEVIEQGRVMRTELDEVI